VFVSLTQDPGADDVTVTLDIDADGTIDDGGGATNSIALTFTTGNWNTPVAITVTAVDDGDAEGNHTATQTYSASQGGAATYDGLSGTATTVNITDNDTAPEEDAEPAATTPQVMGDVDILDVDVSVKSVFVGGRLDWLVTIRNNTGIGLTNIDLVLTFSTGDITILGVGSSRGNAFIEVAQRFRTLTNTMSRILRLQQGGLPQVRFTDTNLGAWESVLITFDTELDAGSDVERVTLNGVLSANAQTLSASDSATVQVLSVTQLRATGETPLWRTVLMLVVGGVLMLMGWLGYRHYRHA
jgi:hypothetical protein